jgi:hypothetical protein
MRDAAFLESFGGWWHKGGMEQLILGLRNQDADEVEKLVASCGDRLFRSACLLCGERAEAQDLMHGKIIPGTPAFLGHIAAHYKLWT